MKRPDTEIYLSIYELSINATDRYLCFEAIDIDGEMIDFFEIGSRPQDYGYCRCSSNISCDGKIIAKAQLKLETFLIAST